MSRLSLARLAPLLLGWVAGASTTLAQLPTARLDGLVPRGAQAGCESEVTLQGADLEEVRCLLFSHPGLSATLVEGTRFKVVVAAEAPHGVHEVRVSGRYGVSTSTVFVVGRLPEMVEPSGNHSRPTAAPIPLPITLNGAADPDATDFFKITAVKGQPVHIDCAAQRIDSPLNAAISVRDPSGVEIQRAQRTLDRDPVTGFVPAEDGEYIIEVHDATWRGGPGFVYRLTVSTDAAAAVLPAPVPLAGALTVPPVAATAVDTELNDAATAAQLLALPADVAGHLDRDWFSFTTDIARPLIIEVVSHRLGVPSDPVLVVHKVSRDAAGVEQSSPVAEFDDAPVPPGCERFRLGSRDPVGRLAAETGTTYRLFVTDRFNSGGRYRLVIREPRPDFQVLVMPESPASDAKALMRWTSLLRRQGSTVLNVAVVRQDGFDEPVTMMAEGLPPGVSMGDCVIPAGRAAGLIVLRASGDAAAWSGRLSLAGHASSQSRPAREVIPRWSVADAGTERVDLRLTTEGPMLAVMESDGVPLQIEAAGPAVFETSLGATLEVPVKFLRAASHKGFKGEWEAALCGLPGQRLWQPSKPAADAAEAKLALVLSKKDGNQFVPGTWTVYAATRGTVQWQPDDKVPVRDLRDASFSAPIKVKIDSSPVALSAPAALNVARGGKSECTVKLDRRFGFAEAVEVSLRLPAELNGITAPAVTAAKETAEVTLALECAAEAPSGRHACVIEAKCQWNGEELLSRRDVTLEITP